MRGDFKEIFDVSQFDEIELGQIEFVLNSPAYELAFKKYLVSTVKTMERLWKDRSKERVDKYPDEFLAGGAAYGEGLIEFFERIIQETQMERVHAAMANMSGEQMYNVKRHQGVMKPVVGLDQQVLPQHADPDEF